MILYILFGVFCMALIWGVGGAILAGVVWVLADVFTSNMSEGSERPGESPALSRVPANAPAPPMTATQNAFQNSYGGTALNAARNSGQNI